MLSYALRQCNSEKVCSDCKHKIALGEKYMSAPYNSLCVKCYDIKKDEMIESSQSAVDIDDKYVITGPCEYCALSAIGILWGHKVCGEHINKAIIEAT